MGPFSGLGPRYDITAVPPLDGPNNVLHDVTSLESEITDLGSSNKAVLRA